MKKLAKLVSVLLLVVLMASLCGSAWAVNTTTYIVRIYAGNQASGGGDDVLLKTEVVSMGGSVGVPQATLPADSNYYQKGMRVAGTDNSDGVYPTSYGNIQRDMDFVISYGVKGTAVKYKVRYVYAANNQPIPGAPEQEFYANIGDKPVVRYVYVAGYQPQAYAIT